MTAAVALVLWTSGCRSDGRPTSTGSPAAPRTEASASVELEDNGPPSWGAPVPGWFESPRSPADAGPSREGWWPSEALAAELARRSRDPGLLALLDGDAPLRERALWSLARIGDPFAAELLLDPLDRGDDLALAAAALLEVPRAEPGSPPDPLDTEFAALEDGLWTRYALTDPASVRQARALLLAIARLGGSRSMARLGVDLSEVPGSDHRVEISARWSSAMLAVGIACARGHVLEPALVEALALGLERRGGVDPAVSLASLYALSRCARSSAELLAESRERLVARREPHVADPSSDAHASLAWRAFAALGEQPSAIPGSLLGRDQPWLIEVEAVRALAVDLDGAALVRARLLALGADALEGPRGHVTVVALQSMRAAIDLAAPEVDAELEALAQQFETARRSEDPQLRKAAALALCELRLLQAIRSGSTTELARCHVLTGAPAVELPTSWLVNLEVEALLRATRDDAAVDGKLRTVAIDDETVLADRVDVPGPDEPGRQLRIARLFALAGAPDSARATPALHALAEIDDAGVLPILRAALISDDPGVLAAAATAVAVRSVDAGKRDLDTVPLLEQIVTQRTAAAELEGRLSAIEALGALARTAVANIDPNPSAPRVQDPEAPWLARTILPLAADPHVAVRVRAREALLGRPQLLDAFDQAERNAAASRPSPFPEHLQRALEREPATGLRVTTSAGVFTIDFRGAPAPINQANLTALAESGFYDGLTFHRVVPGFVVQGGDPRGDGYGGPGYVVPCEWSNLRYERGTVGIALAGKDTGGSQFFVTQAAQPHLDGRYTIVGHVSEGLDVIDALLPGDVIESVEVLGGS